MTFDTAFERSHPPNMNAAPERVLLKACHPDSPNSNCSWEITKSPEKAIEYVRADLLTTARKEAREEAFSKIDEFRKSGCNITFWCTPRAVVTQVTFHDEDPSPDIDKSFQSFNEALEFAIEVATKERERS